MSERVWEEETKAGCYRDEGIGGEDVFGIWYRADGSSFVQVLETNIVVLQWWLAGGKTEPMAVTGKVGETGETFGEVGIV